MKRIYLDNSATTMLDPKVIEAMNEASMIYGNPSSIHSFGQEARKIVDDARDALAKFLNCTAMEVVFTSGGSESDNLAIKGIIETHNANIQYSTSNIQSISNNQTLNEHLKNKKLNEDCKLKIDKLQKPHVIVSAIEHHAVLHTIQELEKEGKIEATYIQPDKNGIVSVSDIEKAIKPNTKLISVMYVNNEIGTVQPIRDIGKMVERINALRSKNTDNRIQITGKGNKIVSCILSPVYFHCDAVQGAEFLNMDVKYLHVDLLTFTAHKIHGPKGVGSLFIKKGTPIKSQVTGGDQEFKKRAGTENVASIAGFAKAIENVESTNEVISKIQTLRDKLENFILKNIPETYLNGDRESRAPHITNISFKNAEGEAIILNLDFLGIAVSSGSACTAHSLDPSHVLTAIKVSRELSHGAIRFSLSKFTTEEEIDKVCEVLPGIIEKLRQMSPFSTKG